MILKIKNWMIMSLLALIPLIGYSQSKSVGLKKPEPVETEKIFLLINDTMFYEDLILFLENDIKGRGERFYYRRPERFFQLQFENGLKGDFISYEAPKNYKYTNEKELKIPETKELTVPKQVVAESIGSENYSRAVQLGNDRLKYLSDKGYHFIKVDFMESQFSDYSNKPAYQVLLVFEVPEKDLEPVKEEPKTVSESSSTVSIPSSNRIGEVTLSEEDLAYAEEVKARRAEEKKIEEEKRLKAQEEAN